MRGFTAVHLTGAIIQTPRLDTVGNDLPRLRFTIAGEAPRWSRGQLKPAKAYTDVTYLGALATSFAKTLDAGSIVDVRGRLDYNEYEVNGETRRSLSVLASRITELSLAGREFDSDGKGQGILKKAINHVTVYGNLVRDAEYRFTPSGASILRYSIASNEAYKTNDGRENERTTYVDCEAWHDLATQHMEDEDPLLKKGLPIVATGLLMTDSYEKSDGQKVFRKKLEIQTADLVATPGESAPTPAPSPPQSEKEETAADPDDLPFDADVDEDEVTI